MITIINTTVINYTNMRDDDDEVSVRHTTLPLPHVLIYPSTIEDVTISRYYTFVVVALLASREVI